MRVKTLIFLITAILLAVGLLMDKDSAKSRK